MANEETPEVSWDGMATLIDGLGQEFYASMIHGNPCPDNARRYKRMTSPQPGDLVMETSTSGLRMQVACDEWIAAPKYPHIKSRCAVGILIKVAQEPVPYTDAEWDEEEEGPRPLETVWYLRLLDTGEEFRWTNADFVTILPCEGWKRMSGMRTDVLNFLLQDRSAA